MLLKNGIILHETDLDAFFCLFLPVSGKISYICNLPNHNLNGCKIEHDGYF